MTEPGRIKSSKSAHRALLLCQFFGSDAVRAALIRGRRILAFSLASPGKAPCFIAELALISATGCLPRCPLLAALISLDLKTGRATGPRSAQLTSRTMQYRLLNQGGGSFLSERSPGHPAPLPRSGSFGARMRYSMSQRPLCAAYAKVRHRIARHMHAGLRLTTRGGQCW
jgi:hypothetical protein